MIRKKSIWITIIASMLLLSNCDESNNKNSTQQKVADSINIDSNIQHHTPQHKKNTVQTLDWELIYEFKVGKSPFFKTKTKENYEIPGFVSFYNDTLYINNVQDSQLVMVDVKHKTAFMNDSINKIIKQQEIASYLAAPVRKYKNTLFLPFSLHLYAVQLSDGKVINKKDRYIINLFIIDTNTICALSDSLYLFTDSLKIKSIIEDKYTPYPLDFLDDTQNDNIIYSSLNPLTKIKISGTQMTYKHIDVESYVPDTLDVSPRAIDGERVLLFDFKKDILVLIDKKDKKLLQVISLKNIPSFIERESTIEQYSEQFIYKNNRIIVIFMSHKIIRVYQSEEILL